jgi:hypothetical protein
VQTTTDEQKAEKPSPPTTQTFVQKKLADFQNKF